MYASREFREPGLLTCFCAVLAKRIRLRRSMIVPSGARGWWVYRCLRQTNSLLRLSLLRLLDSTFPDKTPMDMRIPPLEIKIMLEPSPLRSRILVRRLAVPVSVNKYSVYASHCLATQQQKLLSSPWFWVIQANCLRGPVLQSIFVTDTWPSKSAPDKAKLMCGFYYNFNNLRFNNSQNHSYRVFAACSCVFVSSEIMKGRLLKWLLYHPMNECITVSVLSF